MTERTSIRDPAEGARGQATLEATPQTLCGNCGTAGELRYPELQDRHFDAPGTWALLQCPACQLAWLNPQPSPGDLARLYASYYTHAPPEGDSLFVRAISRGIPAATLGYSDTVIDPWERGLGRLLSYFAPLAQMGQRTTMGLSASARGTLLDFGCGDGAFLRHMRNLGWTVTGVERDPRAAEVARETLGADSVHLELADVRMAGHDEYDAITLSHVIEHLLDPVEALTECANCLRPGGTLVIATPNTASHGHRRFGRSWLHLDPPRHIHLFNPSTLTEIARRAGLHVERVEFPSSSAHFVWQTSSLIERHGVLPDIRVEDLSAWELLKSVAFWMWEYTLTRFGAPRGEELLLTAVKPEEGPREGS